MAHHRRYPRLVSRTLPEALRRFLNARLWNTVDRYTKRRRRHYADNRGCSTTTSTLYAGRDAHRLMEQLEKADPEVFADVPR